MKCLSCPKKDSEVKYYVKLPNTEHGEVYVCGDCIEKMFDLHLKNMDSMKKRKGDTVQIPKVKELVDHLNRFIVSQEQAKRTLAVAVRNHYKRLKLHSSQSQNIDKSNIMLMGESGTGKTAMVKRIAEFVDVPLVIVDSNTFSSAGYVGENVESAVMELYEKAGRNKKLAEKGIIFFDEIDKKRKSPDTGRAKDISGEHVQTALLKLVEGQKVKVGKGVTIDTSNILFIAGGAFVDLRGIIEQRLDVGKIGFNSEKGKEVDMSQIYRETTSEDLITYGMIPELIGRFPVMTYTKSLTEDDIKRILTEPDDAIIKQFKALFELDNINLHFDRNAIDYVAHKVHKDKVGARGIRKVLENILEEIQYNIEDYREDGVEKITMTKNKTNVNVTPRFKYNRKNTKSTNLKK